ncbi:pilus assembly protein [Bradyrhizobium lablabi]|nr:pilus assembly protein [Bradyrhizobium lablabi]
MRIKLMRNVRSIAGLLRDERGSAAVEFSVVVPIMLTLFFGVVEFSSGIAVDRKVTLVARTLSDLTSQSSCVTQTDLDGFLATGKAIMAPYSTTPLVSTVSQVYVDDNLDAKVKWSKGSAPRGNDSTVSIPAGLKVKGTYLIMAEVEYLYVPVGIGYVMKANINLKEQTYTRPRQSASVVFKTSSCA